MLTLKSLTAEQRLQWRRELHGVGNPCAVGGVDTTLRLLKLGAPDLALDHLQRYDSQCASLSWRDLVTLRFLAHRALGANADMVADTESALAFNRDNEFRRLWNIAALEDAGRTTEAVALLDHALVGPDGRVFTMPLRKDFARLREAKAHSGFAKLPARIAVTYAFLPCLGATVEGELLDWFPDNSDAYLYQRDFQHQCDRLPTREMAGILD